MTGKESICLFCGKPEQITGIDGFGEYTYKPHKECLQSA